MILKPEPKQVAKPPLEDGPIDGAITKRIAVALPLDLVQRLNYQKVLTAKTYAQLIEPILRDALPELPEGFVK